MVKITVTKGKEIWDCLRQGDCLKWCHLKQVHIELRTM